ncbi:RICIN domain-containing protein [Streptomyces sp. NPDC054888]
MKRVSSLVTALLAILSVGLLNAAPASAIEYNQLSNGYYLGSTLCATPQGNSTANGTIVTTWSCTGHDLQQWTYRSGWIYHEVSGKCLTPQGNASSTNGAVLTLWTCDWSYNSSQKFVVKTAYPMKVYTWYGGKCITNKGNSMASGVYLTLWTCTNDRVDVQEWNV